MEQDVKENDLIKRKLLNQVTITSLRLSVLSTKSEKNIVFVLDLKIVFLRIAEDCDLCLII